MGLCDKDTENPEKEGSRDKKMEFAIIRISFRIPGQARNDEGLGSCTATTPSASPLIHLRTLCTLL